MLYFQKKKLNQAIKFIRGHICRSEAKQVHWFAMASPDTKVRSFRGDLHFDVKIVRPTRQQQEHYSQEEYGDGEEVDTKRIVIDISDQPLDSSGTTKQVSDIYTSVVNYQNC